MSETMTLVSRDTLLATAKRRFAEVTIEGLGTLRIRSLSAGDSSKIEADTYADNKKKEGSGIAKWKARHIAAAVVDEQGNRLFADKEIDTIQSFDRATVDAIYDAVAKHCGIDNETSEDAEKNSEATHDDYLPSN